MNPVNHLELGMANPTNRILWVVLCVSQFVYVGVAAVNPLDADSLDGFEFLPVAFIGIALASAIGGGLYRRKALVEPIRTGTLDPTTQEGFARAFQPFIVNLMLAESVAIYGLLLSFLSGEMQWVVGFVAASLALMWIHRPTAPSLVPPLDAGVNRPAPIA